MSPAYPIIQVHPISNELKKLEIEKEKKKKELKKERIMDNQIKFKWIKVMVLINQNCMCVRVLLDGSFRALGGSFGVTEDSVPR